MPWREGFVGVSGLRGAIRLDFLDQDAIDCAIEAEFFLDDGRCFAGAFKFDQDVNALWEFAIGDANEVFLPEVFGFLDGALGAGDDAVKLLDQCLHWFLIAACVQDEGCPVGGRCCCLAHCVVW